MKADYEKDDAKKDPEAAIIVAKLRKQSGGKAGDDEMGEGEEGDEEEGDAGEEALRTAGEDLFKAIRGRSPTESEAAEVLDALKAVKAC